MKYVIPLILILIVSSCKQKTTGQNKQLDDLLMDVQLAKDSILAIDTTAIFVVSRTIKRNLKFLHYNLDTIDVNTAAIIAEVYKDREKVFFIEKHYTDFLDELLFTQQQLEKLKIDLGNGLLTEENFNTFYQEEERIFINLNQKIRAAFADAEKANRIIEQQSSKIDSVLIFIGDNNSSN
jgi:hypothetical protein